MNTVKVYSGNEIMAASVKNKLEEAGISIVVRDNIQSATLAGFGSLGQVVNIYVNEEDAEKAKTIIAAD
ncbi:hypothetical protein GCM10007424_14220 [Flavobacterium suaedae]|uniref:DUF2007 domain-containing protein n=1 Tax=Flavobacterium suaedae TaxID=1767027 RepID=A0ABQ1JVV2_9FLAO|nr:DUF2007 domain-containing protein [Flavobacterium suaedae]GGB75443.1 hypothetical protein GCM10007424_14220 [Flavobacterium suaedae]